jgi:ubiquinone/menaquinone biosynthesis C-methylase UbiE
MKLDNVKAEKGKRTKEFQDFFTLTDISKDLFNKYKDLLYEAYKEKKKPLKVLEPAVGSGNLIWPILEMDIPVEVTVMDIQEDYLKHVYAKAKELGYNIEFRKDLMRIKNYS